MVFLIISLIKLHTRYQTDNSQYSQIVLKISRSVMSILRTLTSMNGTKFDSQVINSLVTIFRTRTHPYQIYRGLIFKIRYSKKARFTITFQVYYFSTIIMNQIEFFRYRNQDQAHQLPKKSLYVKNLLPNNRLPERNLFLHQSHDNRYVRIQNPHVH